MKKFSEILKPFYSIIFGALLLLFYLNWLSAGGSALALGIIALIFAIYYIGVGIVTVVCGGSLSAALLKIFDTVSVVLFPLFMFVYFLITVINGADFLGPNGWVIVILSMIASLALVTVYSIVGFLNMGDLKNIAQLLSFVFILALLLDILFSATGDAVVLGNVNVVQFAIYLVFSAMLLSSVAKLGDEPPKAEE